MPPAPQDADPLAAAEARLVRRAPGRVRWWQSLKARIAAGALAALFTGIALTTWHMGRMAEANLLALEQVRSHEEVQRIAAVVGHRVAELQRALRLAGGQMPRSTLDDAPRAAAQLARQPVLRGMFASLAVAGVDGAVRVLVDSSGPGMGTGTGMAEVSLAERDYFRRAIDSGLPAISAPFTESDSNEAIVVFAQPLLDSAGTWGVLAGTLHLKARDLMQDLAETRNYDDSTLIAISDDHGRILAHPQRALIMQTLADEPRLADAATQWNDDGRPLQRNAGRWTSDADVVAMAGEPLTGWHVWRVTSREGLLAPLRDARTDAVAGAAVFALVMAALLLLYLVRQLRPLSRLQARAAALVSGDDAGEWPRARGEIGALVHTLQHVWTESVRVQRLNAQVLHKLSSVMAASPIGLAFSRHHRFDIVSTECCRLLACREQDLIGHPMALIFAAEADYTTFRLQAQAAFAAGSDYEGEWKLRRAGKPEFWARIRARPVADDDTGAASTIWSLNDVDEQIAARETLEHAALHDPLTSVLNRKGFDLQLAAAFKQRSESAPVSIVMLDLDHFKAVNDEGGHAAGDAILEAVAASIAAHVRGTDSVARLGGDEFAILLPRCDQERAAEIATKVLQGIREIALAREGRTFRVGASLGVAELHAAHADAAQWLAAADAACYEAKASGRDRVRCARALRTTQLAAALD